MLLRSPLPSVVLLTSFLPLSFIAAAQDLARVGGYIDIHFNSALKRYVMILDDDRTFYYAESIDALTWTAPISLGAYSDGVNTLAPYPRSVGLGDDPHILGKSFYVYYTFLRAENGGLPREGNSLRRLTLTCP